MRPEGSQARADRSDAKPIENSDRRHGRPPDRKHQTVAIRRQQQSNSSNRTAAALAAIRQQSDTA
eukprot:8386800-Alexandrium_andersonii.AAC.1